MPTVRVDDIELHYVEAGVGAPLLLIHGLGGSHRDWEYQIGEFAQHFRVIAPDLRGFGDSPGGRRLISIPRFARAMLPLLDAPGLARCLLVGHSTGGSIAQQLTLAQPQRVPRLVVAHRLPMIKT